ncbi:glycosyltransferase family 2 protein [Vibrio cholerae]|uniref:glycosyltransferase family 2 protein n=1 Tax=Vibrio cholerae TaxID=666 RepID=UPI00115A8AD4|nr:glycosyltransferase [Vibrio cholerae]TQP52562.1 glycosyltransferase family 2 protein [Vibrio cholerae]TQP93807.1 glycosyltransferase family 2 protein [Vibrio cholerae]
MIVSDKLVSIIMPAYNAESTIALSIDSVISQTYKEWELIVVDDGSYDKTAEIVKSYSIHHNIYLIENHHVKGAAGARKSAIDKANGKYIAFLDSDDIWEDQKLEKQISYMQNNGYGFVYSDYYMFDNSIDNVRSIISPPDKLSYDDLIKNCMIGCLTVVLDRTQFEDFNFPISPKEEYAFWLRLLRQTSYAYRVPGTVSYYRRCSNSLSGNKLKEIGKQWYVIRKMEKTKFWLSLYYMLHYSIKGLMKHFILSSKDNL